MKKILILILIALCFSAYGQYIKAVEPDGLECTSNGIAYIESDVAYGEWEFDIYNGSDANQYRIYFINDTTAIYPNANGYMYEYTTDEKIRLNKISNAPTFSVRWSTIASCVSNELWYKIKIIRSVGGVFTAYISALSSLHTSGTGAPTGAPTALGQTYVNETNGDIYNASYDGSVYSWVLVYDAP